MIDIQEFHININWKIFKAFKQRACLTGDDIYWQYVFIKFDIFNSGNTTRRRENLNSFFFTKSLT